MDVIHRVCGGPRAPLHEALAAAGWNVQPSRFAGRQPLTVGAYRPGDVQFHLYEEHCQPPTPHHLALQWPERAGRALIQQNQNRLEFCCCCSPVEWLCDVL